MCTRPVADELTRKAAAAGLVIDAVPFTSIIYKKTPDLKEVLEKPDPTAALAVFTSSNAVKAVAMQLKAKPAWPVACLEGATRTAVAEAWGTACIKMTAPDAATLARVILASKLAGAVIFFCGNIRLGHLPETLRPAGIVVRELVVYETTEQPVKLEREYDAILFFSPSAVRSFFTLNTITHHTALFAIGRTTAESIATYSQQKIVIAAQPTTEAMIAALTDYFKK